ncbi:iron ABC transporter permease [Paenibacillus mesophilus]|uniref:FecCD family ABC transporter permease n=1 Tax=Paenibacillus mesophilus TaxID=2582849 RepID=UPI00110EE2C0|nr:iron ABC transporter permease [Paenibacillus mesophilus]TMV48050.1 iron ABC transporter permease [Paenibacillus mesophilus]
MSNPIPPKKQNRTRFLLFLFCSAVVLLAAGIVASLKWGQAQISWHTLYEALTYQGQDKAHLYIQTLRLPRALTACIVGIHLALAGLLTQLVTKNPLASPHIFGINAGASLAVVFGLIAVAEHTITDSILFAFVGAAAGAVLIWSLAGGGGQKQPVRLALAGITIHFLLSSLTEGLIIFNQQSTDSMIFWLVGSVSHAGWLEVRTLLPFFAAGLLVIGFMIPSFRLLLIDDELAAGLGQRVAVVRTVGIVLVIVLAGSAVAICGPIGFICLIVPHIARALVGSNLPVLVPLTGLLGGAMLVYADWISRYIAFPFESPVGIVTSAIGAPFFIYLARRQGGAKR